jgi:hypothetical protein
MRNEAMPETNEESSAGAAGPVDDPVLMMRGVGQQMWKSERADLFVDRLRSEEQPAAPLPAPPPEASTALPEVVWDRVRQHQRESFRTVSGLPMTYEIDGSGIWFYRDGKRVNRRLTRNQLNQAISRCPLRTTTEISDLIDYPYIFALLRDSRIRRELW